MDQFHFQLFYNVGTEIYSHYIFIITELKLMGFTIYISISQLWHTQFYMKINFHNT